MLSGLPRFTREFDDFLNSLSNYDQLDWYFLFWNATYNDDVRIPPNWPVDPSAAREKVKNFLPDKSNIIHYEVTTPPQFDSSKSYNLTPWSIAKHIWTMYYGIYAVNSVRRAHETTAKPYDLVIRTRPDIGITEKLDLAHLHDQLKQSPNTVLMPNNHRHGMTGNPVNDLFGIALPDTMNIYAQTFEYIDAYNQAGLPFHGETVLSHHLKVNNINIPHPGFHSVMRLYTNHGGPYVGDTSVEYGRWNT